jgi:putative component of membrane protein insertase Oxa1/YidC/SpoIIIJ protein YidD
MCETGGLRYGFAKATVKTAWRLLRCNPAHGREIKHDPP